MIILAFFYSQLSDKLTKAGREVARKYTKIEFE